MDSTRASRSKNFATRADAMAFLGLNLSDDMQRLRSRYRRLAFENHPDRNPGDQRSYERFKRVREAYLLARQHFESDPGSGGRCAVCGRIAVLQVGIDRRQCCRMCLLRGRRWSSLPAPPTVLVSCAFAFLAMIVAIVCLMMQLLTGSVALGWMALISSGSMLLFLAVISIRIGYAAKPVRTRER